MKKNIRLLIVPKFEIGTMDDGVLGEAELYYQEYLQGADEITLPGGKILYVKNDIALVLTGEGKVNSAITLTQVLSLVDFDFSSCYILSVGCGGGAAGCSTMGDVVLVTDIVDFDLGHRVDSTELADSENLPWFHDKTYNNYAVKHLNQELIETVFERAKNTEIYTTELAKSVMARNFENEAFALLNPKVIKGTSVSGDNYWKGKIGHKIAEEIVRTYGCECPYAVTEMEEIAVASVLEKYGLLDRLIVIRDCVNTDVFMNSDTPEALWSEGRNYNEMVLEKGGESLDIFEVSRHNNFAVGKAIIDFLLG